MSNNLSSKKSYLKSNKPNSSHLPDDKIKRGRKRIRTLDETFAKTVKSFERINSGELSALSSEYKLLHADCLRQLTECLVRVDILELFPTEDINDVTTADLKYMNLQYCIGNVLERTPIDPSSTSVLARTIIIELSVRRYCEFLSLVMNYKIGDMAYYDTAKRYVDSIADNAPLSKPNKAMNFDKKFKGARGKKQTMLERAYLESYEAISKYPNESEERIRAFELKRLEFHISSSWKSIDFLLDELDMLTKLTEGMPQKDEFIRTANYIPTPALADYVLSVVPDMGQTTFTVLNEDLRIRNTGKPTDYSTRVEEVPKGKLLGPNGKVIQPFTILPDEAAKKARKNVFGTGQYLPTVTIEELVQKELENQVKPTIPKNEIEEDEDRDHVQDLLTYKARQWDDFTEENPRGSGNTMNLG